MVKHSDDAGCHLPYFFVDPDEVGIRQVRPLAIGHIHLINVAEHGGNQQIVTLVDLTEVNEKQEYDILENPISLTEIPFLKHLENGLYELIDFAEDLEQLLDFESLRVVHQIS